MPHTAPVFFRGRVQEAPSQGPPGHIAAHNDLPAPGKGETWVMGRNNGKGWRELEKTLYLFQRNAHYP